MSLPRALQRAAGCDGKVGFITRALADNARGRVDVARNVYRCAACGSWHLGRSMQPRHSNRGRRIAEIREREASQDY